MRKIDEQIAYHIGARKPAKLGGLYTVKTPSDDSVELWYQGTCIFRKEGDVITLDNGGYMTPTTKGKINAALGAVLPISYRVFQKEYTWYLSTPYGDPWEWKGDKVQLSETDKGFYFINL